MPRLELGRLCKNVAASGIKKPKHSGTIDGVIDFGDDAITQSALRPDTD